MPLSTEIPAPVKATAFRRPARRLTASRIESLPPRAREPRLPDERPELEREPHVSGDLQLSCQERHLPVQLPGNEVEEIRLLHRDGAVRGGDLPFRDGDLPVASFTFQATSVTRNW